MIPWDGGRMWVGKSVVTRWELNYKSSWWNLQKALKARYLFSLVVKLRTTIRAAEASLFYHGTQGGHRGQGGVCVRDGL